MFFDFCCRVHIKSCEKVITKPRSKHTYKRQKNRWKTVLQSLSCDIDRAFIITTSTRYKC